MRTNLPGTVLEKLTFKGKEQMYIASFCLSRFHTDRYYKEARYCLNKDELDYLNTLKFGRRIQSYLLGRYVAKAAGSLFANEHNWMSLGVERGVFTQPVLTHPQVRMNISLSHSNEVGVAIVYPEGFVMGIDIELITMNNKKLLESQLTDGEKKLFLEWKYRLDALPTLFWTCKESLSKVLRTGLTSPLHIFEINSLSLIKSELFLAEYKNFSQYRTVSVVIDPYVLSLTYPKITEPDFEYVEDMIFIMKSAVQYQETDFLF